MSTTKTTNAKRNSNQPIAIKAEMSTTEIINEFVNNVDTDKVYSLKELKDVLGEIYKAKSNGAKKSSTKKTKVTKDAMDTSDEEPETSKKGAKKDANKPKKAPSAYNNYVKFRIEQLKLERTDVAPRDLLKLAAADWKQLDRQEQEKFKL